MRVIARMNVGGPAVQVTGLMRHLDTARYEQRLYTGWCAADEADYLLTQAPDVETIRVAGLGRAVRPSDDVLAIHRIHRAIREFNPHIIHTHTAKAGVIGRTAALLAGTRAALVHTFHGHLLHGYFPPAKTRAVIELERFLAHRTDAIVAVGAQVRDDLLAVGIGHARQYTVIPPGLEFPLQPSRDEARTCLGWPADAIVIALIGRLTSIKRADRFADAVALIAAAHPDKPLRFIVAGDGESAAALQHDIAERSLPITMLGWRTDIPAILAGTDLLMLTSDNEGTPVSLIQAAMSGVPVVATDVGSVKEIVEDEVTGLLCSTTAKDLAVKVSRLINEPDLRHRLGSRARAQAQGRYSVERLAADHAELYERLAHSKAGR